MSKIALVTDSTAYIPNDLVKKYNISVAPQILIWGKETFEDGVNILPTEFYSRLQKATVMPSSSQVTVTKFQEIFQQLLDQDYQVLAILISAKLSGTINSAVQAKAMLPEGAPIEICDSYTTAMGMGFQVLSVARAAEEGASLPECVKLAQEATKHVGVYFVVDTLEFLHRGGRIGGASRFLGTALNIKPLLEVRDGVVDAVERVRTRRKSLTRLIQVVEEQVKGQTPVRLATLHANAAEDAHTVLEEASQKLHPLESVYSEVSPVVGVYAGPGTVGLAYMAGM